MKTKVLGAFMAVLCNFVSFSQQGNTCADPIVITLPFQTPIQQPISEIPIVRPREQQPVAPHRQAPISLPETICSTFLLLKMTDDFNFSFHI